MKTHIHFAPHKTAISRSKPSKVLSEILENDIISQNDRKPLHLKTDFNTLTNNNKPCHRFDNSVLSRLNKKVGGER